MMNKFHYSLPLVLTAMMLGCSDGRVALPTAPVSGTVTYQGKPLAMGRVVFFHSSGQMAGADIDANGAFNLTAYQGENQVAIECFKSYSRMMTDAESLIPHHYSNYSTSGLTFEVKSDEESNVAEFVLKN